MRLINSGRYTMLSGLHLNNEFIKLLSKLPDGPGELADEIETEFFCWQDETEQMLDEALDEYKDEFRYHVIGMIDRELEKDESNKDELEAVKTELLKEEETV